MRLFVISDLHLEKRPLAEIGGPKEGFDLLVCAGDIWEGEPERAVEALVALAGDRPAIIVPGNHDRYRRGPADPRTCDDLLGAMHEAVVRQNGRTGETRLTMLQGGEAASVEGVTFIGATLWTDWTLAGLWRPDVDRVRATADAMAFVTDAITGSREYRGSILRADGAMWRPQDAVQAHRCERDALRRALARPCRGPRVVVTHHAPLTEILTPYRDKPGVPWWIPAFYASEILSALPEASRPDLWVSGHFHARHDLDMDGIRCVANPVAAADYDPAFVVDLAVAEPT